MTCLQSTALLVLGCAQNIPCTTGCTYPGYQVRNLTLPFHSIDINWACWEKAFKWPSGTELNYNNCITACKPESSGCVGPGCCIGLLLFWHTAPLLSVFSDLLLIGLPLIQLQFEWWFSLLRALIFSCRFSWWSSCVLLWFALKMWDGVGSGMGWAAALPHVVGGKEHHLLLFQ